MSEEARQLQSGSHGILHRLKRARRFVQWWPLATAPGALILHIEIELNFVSYWPSPQEHSPFLIGFGFRILFLATLLLALFIFPRWQSFVALLVLGYIILSGAGR
jgi:hypothetical protein